MIPQKYIKITLAATGLGSLRYPRYPGDTEQKTWSTGYWQLGLGTLRYPRYPGDPEQKS